MAELKDWKMRMEGSPLFTEWLHLAAAAGMGEVVSAADLKVEATDALIVVDMQNDFIPVDSLNPHGGAFGVSEGADVVDLIVQLMQKFGEAGAMVVPTRDYHPIDHCSFIPTGGPFPPHCIQGSIGSHFYKTIGTCARRLQRRYNDKVQVVFKGYHEDVDSFGSFEYPEDYMAGRVSKRDCPDRLHGCTLPAWTGCIALKCSNMQADINAPPDILAALRRENLSDILKKAGIKRIFACGLALDFCVLDTCLNGASAGFEEVYMVLDAARAAHLPGIGSVGSGFLNDHADIKAKMLAKKVKLVPSAALLPGMELGAAPPPPDAAVGAAFPAKLGPFGLVPINCAGSLKMDRGTRRYVAKLTEGSPEHVTLGMHGLKPEGPCSPPSALTLPEKDRALLGIPAEATSFMWANPIDGILDAMDDQKRGYMCTTSPLAAFLSTGGFAYFDKEDKCLEVMAMTLGEGLTFHGPEPFRRGYASGVKDRWQPITLNDMKAKGAVSFAWINPGEVLQPGEGGGEPWSAAEHGAFAYIFSEDLATHDERNVIFAVSGLSKHDPSRVGPGRLGLSSSYDSLYVEADDEPTEVAAKPAPEALSKAIPVGETPKLQSDEPPKALEKPTKEESKMCSVQ